jgi:hypothetical protein
MSDKSERIGLGLAILHAPHEPGECFSYTDIAEWCGCTPEAIKDIQEKALARLRRALERQNLGEAALDPSPV